MPALGSTLKINVTFRDDDSNLVDPNEIEVDLYDSDNDSVLGATPTTPERLSTGKYLILWDPDATGRYTLVVTGMFDAIDDITLEQVFVITEDNDDTTAPILEEDVVIMFSAGYDPMLIDPETVHPYYPDAPLIEIAQWVHKFSLEVAGIFPNGEYPDTAYDYTQAATLCALSRKFEGMGISNYSGFTLGDLQVMDTTNSQTSKTDRGNVTSWCELAEILRRDMKMAKGGIVSSVKAGSWRTPIPDRRLRKAERFGGGPRHRRY